MKRGDKIMIYEDPITCLKPEGEAILGYRTKRADAEFEYWKVTFPTPGVDDLDLPFFERKIKKE